MIKFFTRVICIIICLVTFTLPVYADTTTETTSTITVEQFYEFYMDQMMNIVNLRSTTAQKEAANQKQLTSIKQKLETMKDSSTKSLETQIKQLKDTGLTLKNQLKTLSRGNKDSNSQLKALKKQIEDNKAEIKTLEDQLKTAKIAVGKNISGIKPIQDQLTILNRQILADTKAKNQVWVTYSKDLKAKNYAAAETDLQTIATDKTNIIAELTQKNILLTQMLTALNQQQ